MEGPDQAKTLLAYITAGLLVILAVFAVTVGGAAFVIIFIRAVEILWELIH